MIKSQIGVQIVYKQVWHDIHFLDIGSDILVIFCLVLFFFFVYKHL